MKFCHRYFAYVPILCLVLVLGCTSVPLERTLPEAIETVYVPMFKNLTYEPGIEELITNHTIESFLADGRLTVVQQRVADARVEGAITDYKVSVSSFASDDFPMMSTAQVAARVTVWIPQQPDAPIATFPDIRATVTYISDPRSTVYENVVGVKERLFEALAFNIVKTVMTGSYPTQPEK
jgi:hypothetical protein